MQSVHSAPNPLAPSALTSALLTACGGSAEIEGTITSPNYPSDYPDDLDILWIIMAEPGQTIRADIVDFALELDEGCDQYDYVEFRSVPTRRTVGNVRCGK